MRHGPTKVLLYEKRQERDQKLWHFLGEAWTIVKEAGYAHDDSSIYEMRFFPNPCLFQVNQFFWNGQMYGLLQSIRRLASGNLVVRMKAQREGSYVQRVA